LRWCIGKNAKFVGMNFMQNTSGNQADHRNGHNLKTLRPDRVRHLLRLLLLALTMPIIAVPVRMKAMPGRGRCLSMGLSRGP
jgi:hypothetical protein